MKKYTQYVLVILLIFIIVVLISDIIVFREGLLTGVDTLTPSQKDQIKQKTQVLAGAKLTPEQREASIQRDINKMNLENTKKRTVRQAVNPEQGAETSGQTSGPTSGQTSGSKQEQDGQGSSTGKDACVVNPNSDDCAIQKCMGSKACIKSISASAGKVNPASKDVDTSYSYVSFIKSPKDLKMSDKGNIKTLKKDIDGLMSYVELLIEGTSKASKSTRKGPLGNKFFINSGGKCNNVNSLDPTKRETDRYLYINNVPLGKVPFTSDMDNMKDFRGLIPGMMEHLDIIDPSNIMTAFTESGTPDCQEITMETIDSKNKVMSETHFVTLSDIKTLDACLFPANKDKKRINPVTKEECKEGFAGRLDPRGVDVSDYSNYNYNTNIDYILNDISNDYISQLFLVTFSLFGIYLMTKSLKRMI